MTAKGDGVGAGTGSGAVEGRDSGAKARDLYEVVIASSSRRPLKPGLRGFAAVLAAAVLDVVNESSQGHVVVRHRGSHDELVQLHTSEPGEDERLAALIREDLRTMDAEEFVDAWGHPTA